jgi:phytoene/squalene synthetase
MDLARYTHHLSTAVTDALQYFIGHGQFVPQSQSHCLATTAAHITHMLRDTFEDVAAGYYNIPVEFLEAHGIDPWDVESAPIGRGSRAGSSWHAPPSRLVKAT